MICKYCGSPLKPGETTCGKCGSQQDSMVQMEKFDDGLYMEQPVQTEGTGTAGIIESSGSADKKLLYELEKIQHSVQEERRRGRSFRRKMVFCLLLAIVINLLLAASCIWLYFRVNSLEKSAQECKSAWEEQAEREKREEAERLEEEERLRQEEREEQQNQEDRQWNQEEQQEQEDQQWNQEDQQDQEDQQWNQEDQQDQQEQWDQDVSPDSQPGGSQNYDQSDQI